MVPSSNVNIYTYISALEYELSLVQVPLDCHCLCHRWLCEFICLANNSFDAVTCGRLINALAIEVAGEHLIGVSCAIKSI